MFMKFWLAIVIVVLPAMAQAADVSGIPKIREGDQIQIGNARIRLAGIDAPSACNLPRQNGNDATAVYAVFNRNRKAALHCWVVSSSGRR